MAISTRWLVLAACVSLLACPLPPGPQDGSDVGDGAVDVPPARNACSGGCALNQVCDEDRRVCVDGCTAAGSPCDAGICTRVGNAESQIFTCSRQPTVCGANTCPQGQTVCRAGARSCAGTLAGRRDSCEAVGQWCAEPQCRPPQRYQECAPGGSPCPLSHSCVVGVLGGNRGVCLRQCAGDTNCDNGEFCGGVSGQNFCIASGLFNNGRCVQTLIADGGGFVLTNDAGVTFDAGTPLAQLVLSSVSVSNTCLVRGQNGVITDPPGRGTGNCSYIFWRTWQDGTLPLSTCRAPGQAALGDACRVDFARAAVATQCGTGLECAPVRGRDSNAELGVCMRMCNANIPAPFLDAGQPQPACAVGDECVNIYRYQDPNRRAVVGVCMKPCNIFSAASTCPAVGAAQTSCLPVNSLGETITTLDGTGVCVPQRTTLAGLGQACDPVDALRGAACGSGQICIGQNDGGVALCTRLCDTSCTSVDGGPLPTRCQTQPNATCAAGTVCRPTVSTSGNRVGVCQP